MIRPDLSNWNPFEDHSCGDYNSNDDSEFQNMKASYENMSPVEQSKYKNDLYDGRVQDGTIENGDMP